MEQVEAFIRETYSDQEDEPGADKQANILNS